jgi:hypothetical protein
MDLAFALADLISRARARRPSARSARSASPRSTCRTRSATASSASTRRPPSTPGPRCSSTMRTHPDRVRDEVVPLLGDPGGPRCGARRSRSDPHRDRGPHRPRRPRTRALSARAGRPTGEPGPRRLAPT